MEDRLVLKTMAKASAAIKELIHDLGDDIQTADGEFGTLLSTINKMLEISYSIYLNRKEAEKTKE
ncbi:hypothetical protein LCGC14_0959580 [marine sediment metagenome]|uniref:Uncharacterized protein n=1 Tax=marine sediment metagenome TaxID=412755 RepID=A0A0F9NJJ7_9ZZZZ